MGILNVASSASAWRGYEYFKEKLYDLVEEKISKMKKNELQNALWQVLTDSPEWVFDRFVREYIEY